MKSTKWKIGVAFLLIAILIVSSIPLTVFANESDTPTTTYTVGKVSASAGDTVSIPVTLNNPFSDGFCTGIFTIIYNEDALSLTNLVCGKDFNEVFEKNGTEDWSSVKFANFANPITGSGEFVVLTFEVSEDASPGTYSITLDCSGYWFMDSNWQSISTATVTPGSITVGNDESDTPTTTDDDPVSGGSIIGNDYVVLWDYGGSVVKDDDGYVITAQSGYVIDEILVDGKLVKPYDSYHNAKSYIWNGDTPIHALSISFAYTANFNAPANGTLSVSRDGKTLESGDIVRGGDILTIVASPATGYALDGGLVLVGLTKTGDNTYRVDAKNGDPTPSITANFVKNVYNITVDTEYISVPSTATVGDSVKVTVQNLREGMVLEQLTYTANGVTKEITDYQFTMPNGSVTISASFKVTAVNSLEQLKLALELGQTDITLSSNIEIDPNWTLGSKSGTVTIHGEKHTLTIPSGGGLTIASGTHVVLEDMTLVSKVSGTAVKLADKATLDLYSINADGSGVTKTFFENKADGAVMNIYSLTALAENMAADGLTLDLTSETIFWPTGKIDVESFQVGERTGSGTYPVCIIKPAPSGYRVVTGVLSTETSTVNNIVMSNGYTVTKNTSNYPYTLQMEAISTEGESVKFTVEDANVQYENGGQFTVDVYFDNHIAGGVSAGSIDLEFDTKVFKLVGAVMGEEFANADVPSIYSTRVDWGAKRDWVNDIIMYQSCYTNSGKLLTLTFEFASPAVNNGTYEISASPSITGWKNIVSSIALDRSTSVIEPGTITVYGGLNAENETGKNYKLETLSTHGEITLSKTTADWGDTFTVTGIQADEGYLLSSLKVTYTAVNEAGSGYVIETKSIDLLDRSFTIPDHVVSNNISVVAAFMKPGSLTYSPAGETTGVPMLDYVGEGDGIWFADASGTILRPSADGRIHVAAGAKIYIWRTDTGRGSAATVKYQVSPLYEEESLTITGWNFSTSTAEYLCTVDKETTVYVSFVTMYSCGMLADFVPDDKADVGRDWQITFQSEGLPEGVEPARAPYAKVSYQGNPAAYSYDGAVFGAGRTVTLNNGTAPYGYTITDIQAVTDTGETQTLYPFGSNEYQMVMPSADVAIIVTYASNIQYPVTITQLEEGMGTVYIRASKNSNAWLHPMEDNYWTDWTTDEIQVTAIQYLQVKVENIPDGYVVESVIYDYPDLGISSTSYVAPYQQSMSEGTLTISAAIQKAGERSISNQQELEQFRADVAANPTAFRGVTVCLTDDITLTGEWTPIGTEEAPFYGTFDGNGHTISSMTIHYYEEAATDKGGIGYTEGRYFGLFGYINHGTIQNLTVRGSITGTVIDTRNYVKVYAGGIVGYAYYGCTLTNCTSAVNITIKGSGVTAGGVLGCSFSNLTENVFTRCLNYGNLTLETSSSSIVGDVLVAESGFGTAGGIAGEADYVTMTECGNYGTIYGTSTTQSNGAYMPSGFLGGLIGNVNSLGSIEQSFNHGNISGRMVDGGGLVANSNTTSGGLTITDCYNTGAVTHMGDCEINSGSIQYLAAAGLVGSSMMGSSGMAYPVTLMNCYSTAANTSKQNTAFTWNEFVANTVTADTTIINCYGPTKLAAMTDEEVTDALNGDDGSSFLYNEKTGLTELAWENGGTVTTGSYKVTFHVTPANAKVMLFYDAAHTKPIEGWTNGEELNAGETYFYVVSAEKCFEETGSFKVVAWDMEITADLSPMATVVFHVTPADALVTVHHVDNETLETGTGDGSGMWTFYLIPGERYQCSVKADGYTSKTFIVDAQEGSSTLDPITLTRVGEQSGGDGTGGTELVTKKGGDTIDAEGCYIIEPGTSGTIYIKTTQDVTLIGTGVSPDDCFRDLTIQCLVPGAHLTLQDLYIKNNVGQGTNNGDTNEGDRIIEFIGSGNYLDFIGDNLLDQQEYVASAAIHVPSNGGLTIGKYTSESGSNAGTLYLYKYSEGSGIGGDAGEACGTITIAGGNLFLKGSKTGALIGGDANDGSKNGDITINGGYVNLINVAQGAAIGSSRTGTCAGNVTINGGVVTIITSYTGSAIGNGAKTPSYSGTFRMTGGSLKCVRTGNSLYGNGDTTTQIVDDSLLTADRGNLALLIFDAKGQAVTVTGYGSIEAGHNHRYTPTISSTIGNWDYEYDSNVYLYLDKTKAEGYTLACGSGKNQKEYQIMWNAETETFDVMDETGSVITPPESSGEETKVPVESETEVNKDGVSDTTVKDEAVDEAIEKAGENGYLVIDARPSDETAGGITVSEANVTISAASAAKAAENTSGITVKSAIGELTLTSSTLSSITEGAADEDDVNINMKFADKMLEINVSVGGKQVLAFDTPALLSFDAAAIIQENESTDDSSTNSRYVAVKQNPDGTYSMIKKSMLDDSTAYVLLDGPSIITLLDNAKSFDDIILEAWYVDAVAFASSHELFIGVSETEFAPEEQMTRAMLVTVLYRLEDTPSTETLNSFADVPSDWYTDAVDWAYENGIVIGYSEDVFAPDDNVTREQIATILYRYMQYIGLDVTVRGELDGFTDSGDTSDWAVDAMEWAIGAGLLIGNEDGSLNPAGDATRAEAAALLQRIIRLMVG